MDPFESFKENMRTSNSLSCSYVPLFKQRKGGEEVQGISESEITLKVTIDGETRELKLTPKQSGTLKAIAYLDGISPFQKVIDAIVSDLKTEVLVVPEVDP